MASVHLKLPEISFALQSGLFERFFLKLRVQMNCLITQKIDLMLYSWCDFTTNCEVAKNVLQNSRPVNTEYLFAESFMLDTHSNTEIAPPR
jgi:hypothetical protein